MDSALSPVVLVAPAVQAPGHLCCSAHLFALDAHLLGLPCVVTPSSAHCAGSSLAPSRLYSRWSRWASALRTGAGGRGAERQTSAETL